MPEEKQGLTFEKMMEVYHSMPIAPLANKIVLIPGRRITIPEVVDAEGEIIQPANTYLAPRDDISKQLLELCRANAINCQLNEYVPTHDSEGKRKVFAIEKIKPLDIFSRFGFGPLPRPEDHPCGWRAPDAPAEGKKKPRVDKREKNRAKRKAKRKNQK